MRNILTATAHTIGYLLLTSSAVWLLFRYVP